MWSIMVKFGQPCSTLVNIGLPWSTWPTLVNLGQLWSTLVNFGQHWPTLVNISLPWSTLVNLGQPWSILVNLGQPWSTFFRFKNYDLQHTWIFLAISIRCLRWVWTLTSRSSGTFSEAILTWKSRSYYNKIYTVDPIKLFII